MAQILVRARDKTLDDPDLDRLCCRKRGTLLVAFPDSHVWGSQECLPKFVVIKIPLITVEQVSKYVQPQLDGSGDWYRRRRWKIRWDDLPAAAKLKLGTDGELTIKATAAYTGEYDYTWTQIKSYFRNLETDTDETEDL